MCYLFRRAKRNYCNDLTLSNVTDNRFWKTIRPLFANKIKVKNKINLDEDSQPIKGNQKVVANIFNSLFVNTASSLKGAFSGLRQLLASKSPLKMMKNAF